MTSVPATTPPRKTNCRICWNENYMQFKYVYESLIANMLCAMSKVKVYELLYFNARIICGDSILKYAIKLLNTVDQRRLPCTKSLCKTVHYFITWPISGIFLKANRIAPTFPWLDAFDYFLLGVHKGQLSNATSSLGRNVWQGRICACLQIELT